MKDMKNMILHSLGPFKANRSHSMNQQYCPSSELNEKKYFNFFNQTPGT